MRGSILVADDEAVARHGVAEGLQEEGYQVYEAADGQAALQALEEFDLDLRRVVAFYRDRGYAIRNHDLAKAGP